MSWTIDPESFRLTNPERPRYTADEWTKQEWPACPVCGDQVYVNRVDDRRSVDREDYYVAGTWECYRGCDPRPGR